jgi:ureidoacrylate peracid hydrolase
VGTNVCVESTVRDAFTHDVPVLVVSDGTAALTKEEHEASLKSMRFFGQVADIWPRLKESLLKAVPE